MMISDKRDRTRRQGVTLLNGESSEAVHETGF